MKLIKIVALILAAAFLCIGLASGASAESTPYEEAVARYERMKVSAINIGLEYEGAYTTKASYFYAREVTGVAEDGSFILGPWRRIREATYVMGYSETYFNLPGTYVMFGYSFDIMWGTDWPFSGVFWSDITKDVDTIRITQGGHCRFASITITVDGKVVVKDPNCSSHSEWRP